MKTTPILEFRPLEFTDEDFQLLSDIVCQVWPIFKESPAELRRIEEKFDRKLFRLREFIYSDGQVVGYGTLTQSMWTYRKDKLNFSVALLPEARGKGIGSAYLNRAVDEIVNDDIVALGSGTLDSSSDSLAFLKRHAFVEKLREPMSQLAVESFDPDAYEDTIEAAAQAGVRFLSLDEYLSEDSEGEKRLYELVADVVTDIPSNDTPVMKPFDIWVEQRIKDPALFREAMIVAVDDGVPVATTALWKTENEPEMLWTGITGVVRSHRRRGLAIAVKAKSLRQAKDSGYKFVKTDNEESNPMYGINQRLGFKPLPTWVEFEKSLRD